MKDMLLSLFNGYTDTCPTETSLEQIVTLIRSNDTLATRTEKFRYYTSQQQRTAAQREKAACPCFAVSVRFTGGKQRANISGWTSLCLADFDHLAEDDMKRCLALAHADAHTLLAYTTISGTGIRIISAYVPGKRCTWRTDNGLHTEAFVQINRYYADKLGVPYDRQCKNATRLSGLAHDPDAFLNLQAVPSP